MKIARARGCVCVCVSVCVCVRARFFSADVGSMHVRPCESGSYSEELRDTKGWSLNADRYYHFSDGPPFLQLQARRTSARSVLLVAANHQDLLRGQALLL